MVSHLLIHAECTLRHFLPDQRSHELEATVIVQRDVAEETEIWGGDDVCWDGASAYALLRRTMGGGECVRVAELMERSFSIASLPPDIGAEIRKDFPDDHEEVSRTIESFIRKHDHLAYPRIVRCILYLSKTRNQSIEWALEVGAGDPRDVMLLAEYVGLKSDETPTQVRDFSKPFGQNELK